MTSGIAWAAFGVSLGSLVTSIGSLGWQAAVFRLSGSIVKIQLKGAVHLGGGNALTGDMASMARIAQQKNGHLFYAVEVANRGRTPVSVVNIALANKPGVVNFPPTEKMYSPEPRLEANSEATWFFPLGPVYAMTTVTGGKKHPDDIRAVVTVAGGKRVTTKWQRVSTALLRSWMSAGLEAA